MQPNGINPIRMNPGGLPNLQPDARTAPGASFTETLVQAVGKVDALQKEAGKSMKGLAGGDDVSMHHAMIAMEKADLSFRLLLQMRNKVMNAYQQIMRMQI